MRKYSRRDMLKLGASGLGGLIVAESFSGARAQTDSETVNITYDWTYNGPPGKVAEYWQTLKQRLDETDHGVRLGELGETTFENLYASVEAQIRAGSGSDTATWYSDYHTFRAAYLDSIDPIGDLVTDATKQNWLINESSLFNGQYWGNPLVMEIAVLAANRKLLEQAGVQVEDRFESWDAFIEACEKLKSAGITPIQAGTSDGFNAEKWLYCLEFQACDNITDMLGGILGTLSVDAPFFKFPREQLARLVSDYMNANPQNDTEEMATSKFMAGNAGMMMMYLSPLVAPDTPAEFDVVGFPKEPVKFNRPAVGVADNLIVLGHTEKQEAIGRLFDFMNEAEQVNLWYQLNGTLPAGNNLDTGALPAPARKVWDMVMEHKDQPFGMWWPGNLPPSSLFTYQYGVTQNQFAGAGADAARAQTEEIFSNWRSQHPTELEIVRAYQQALAETAGVSPS